MKLKSSILTLILILTFSSMVYSFSFKDVDNNAWYSKSVYQAYDYGLMKGDPNFNFRPNSPVTRAEMAQVSVNIYNKILQMTKHNEDTLNVVANAIPLVVIIQTETGFGSGVVIGGNKILTAKHVVKNAITITVFTSDGAISVGKVIKMSEQDDLAIVQIDRELKSEIKLADEVNVGQDVLVIGHPEGYVYSVTKGIVSHTDREINGEKYIQVDAAINGGNSGGAVINMDGELIGIVKGKVMNGEGLGFATHIDRVREFLK